MDMRSTAKDGFIDAFEWNILKTRGMEYKIQFTGPTGSNAVEAAVKLARKATNRTNVISFTNGFHGCSLGALALTGNHQNRHASKSLLNQATRAAYDGYYGEEIDTSDLLEKILCDPSGGVDTPAAFILETVQGEGGLNTASAQWCKKIERIARDLGSLLIVDDIQAGCGRTGSFFSFETLDITPDIVVMAKSISGYGLPMSLVLIKPEFDIWNPGEHNGTFRGNNHAFVTSEQAINHFWTDPLFMNLLNENQLSFGLHLNHISDKYNYRVKGRGMMKGIDFLDERVAAEIRRENFKNGLITETCGPRDEIVKLLPPITVSITEVDQAMAIFEHSIARATA